MLKKIYKIIEKKFLTGCSDYNSVQVRRKCRSKKQARAMFEKLGVPHAKGTTFFLPFKALSFIKQHGFPVVVKPNVGGFSRGSYFPINNYKEFWEAYFGAKKWWPESVIETYVLGKNYRVVATPLGTEIINERFAPFVIGDGIKTVRELMQQENAIRDEMKLLPIVHHMEENKATQKHLKKQGYSFDSILKPGEKITLFHRIALSPGGSFKNIDLNIMTEKNNELMKLIVGAFDANIFGIDVIMEKGLGVDYDQQKCIFLELNSRPYLKMHTFPRYGEVPDLTDFYKRMNSLEIEGRGEV